MRPTARRNFHANLITCLIAAYSSLEDQSGLVHAADGYLAMLDEYYRDPEIVRRRPYISKEMSYLVCYYSMCTSPLLDERNLQAYYERYRRFADSAAADAGNLLTNRQGFYTISAEYYNRRGDYPRALAYLDSLTVQLRPGGVTSQLVAISANKAKILERMGRYKEACGVYNEVGRACATRSRRTGMPRRWANWKCSTDWTRPSVIKRCYWRRNGRTRSTSP